MKYLILFSKRWFLLIALLIHCYGIILLVRMRHTHHLTVKAPIAIASPTLDQAGLRAQAHSFNPNLVDQSGQPSVLSNTARLQSSNSQRTNKKKINVADAKNSDSTGYVYSTYSVGTTLSNKKSSLNVPATTHNTMYANYCAKMVWHLQATTRHMRDLNFLLKKIYGIKTLRVRITIARDGSLLEYSLVSSCGCTELDESMIKAIKQAHPYPPLPNYFPSNTFIYDGWFSIEGLK